MSLPSAKILGETHNTLGKGFVERYTRYTRQSFANTDDFAECIFIGHLAKLLPQYYTLICIYTQFVLPHINTNRK